MNVFETLQDWIEIYPLATLFIILFFALIHPFIGGPLSLGVQTLYIAYFDSLWVGSLLMYAVNILGIFGYYFVIRNIKERIFLGFNKKPAMQKLLHWAEEKSPWQHTLALGLPFLYTYPIRIILAMKTSWLQFTGMLSLSYLMLMIFNALMLYSVAGIVLGTLPVYVPIGFFLGVLWLIYFGKQYLNPRKTPQK